jgi:predicted  nucleic acid-binding Zn-ribbon protein
MDTIDEQVRILIELQRVAAEIVQAERQIAGLAEASIDLDRQLADKKNSLEAEHAGLEGLKKTYREMESESAVNDGRIFKSDAKLREVKTNKEYQSILKEIDELRARRSQIEDRMLAHLDVMEAAEAAHRRNVAHLSQLAESTQSDRHAIDAKVQRQQEIIAQLNRQKERVGAKADPKILAVMTQVQKKVRGLAVVAAEHEVCMGCHMNIPAQLYNELQRCDALRFCPHCHRIIYWRQSAPNPDDDDL